MKRYSGKKYSRKNCACRLVTLMTKFLLLSLAMIIWDLDAKALSVHVSDVYATQDQVWLHQDEKEMPMPVTLTSFDVSLRVYEGRDAAHIEWTMSSEIGTEGFYISRSTTDYYDDAVTISGFIPCLGGVHSQYISEYEYWDTRIISSRITYAYWLQEVKHSGRTIYGPLYIGGEIRTVDDVPAEVPQPNMKIYLPILMD